jgi:phenylalanyl-tRNA synthetase alpha chain
MASVQDKILQTLDKDGEIADTRSLGDNQTEIGSVLRSLESKEMVTFKQLETDRWMLSAEGKGIVEKGSYEAILFEAVQKAVGGLSIGDVAGVLGKDGKIGQQNALKKKWVSINKETKALEPLVETIQDTTRQELQQVAEKGTLADASSLTDLKKRKLIDRTKLISYRVAKGQQFSLTVQKLETDLTAEMITSGAWKQAQFKKYNFNAAGAPVRGGALHPLNKVREEFRNIFFELGFEEMATNNYVESSFWNFDALYVPQQHPARDLQDTFYIKDPATTDTFPDDDYVERVKAVHQDGAHGSIGYRYPWVRREASKLVLRTHTTAISTAMLYKLANQPGGFRPAKFFSIDRVFRNEAVDATHLAEFHQVEGVIADRNLTLGDLIGFMELFFSKMGVRNLRFKPAYNPYTEPSMEIFSYHEGLKKWVEIGNSGMFRPEMLEPMGLPKDVRVHGWGLSLERPTMIKYGIDNIRELLGHKCDLDMIESNAAVRLDKGSISARG